MEGVTELARFAILLLGLVINQASTERTFSDLKVKKTRLRNCLGIEKLGKMSKVNLVPLFSSSYPSFPCARLEPISGKKIWRLA